MCTVGMSYVHTCIFFIHFFTDATRACPTCIHILFSLFLSKLDTLKKKIQMHRRVVVQLIHI
jgi:hypothetical protein